VGWRQHAIVPGPNSGWSEAATAGAIQRRLVGPIVMGGKTITEIWLGDATVPPAGEDGRDLRLAMALAAATGVLTAGLSIAILVAFA
jgi:adenosylcobinamide-phosphate synthase